MKLTIFAATGGIGRQLLEQAVAAGHDVTAVVRNPGKLSRQVRTVTADLAAADPAALESAVAGAGAVLSGLGPRSASDAGIVSQGTRAIVAAMQATGVRRVLVVSAAPAPWPRPAARCRRNTPRGRVLHAAPVRPDREDRVRQGLRRSRWRTSLPAAAWTGPSSGRRN